MLDYLCKFLKYLEKWERGESSSFWLCSICLYISFSSHPSHSLLKDNDLLFLTKFFSRNFLILLRIFHNPLLPMGQALNNSQSRNKSEIKDENPSISVNLKFFAM